jgi:hypothetical protein
MVNSRPRGILSDADRDYLKMDAEEREEEYSRPGAFKRQQEIQERFRNALLDFPILHSELGKHSRTEVFSPLIEEMWPWSPQNLVSDTMGLLILGVLENTNRDLDDEEFYESVFENSIRYILQETANGAENIDVDVSIDGWLEIDEIHKGEDLADIRPEVLRTLLQAGEISDTEFAEAILEQENEE